jgi:hypothetical protein
MGYADRYPEVGLSEALLAIAGASRQPGSYAPEQTLNDAVHPERLEKPFSVLSL